VPSLITRPRLAGIFRRPAQPEPKSSACHTALWITTSDKTWWRRPAKYIRDFVAKCRDVLRFLGHRVPLQVPIHPKFAGQVLTDLKVRPEGVRLKHRVKSNSLKMYDKFGRGLRIETTIVKLSLLILWKWSLNRCAGPRKNGAWHAVRILVAHPFSMKNPG
jgi:hypothetical protein